MEISNLLLPAANRFASEYLRQTDEIKTFFHYSYKDQGADRERLEELAQRDFPRNELAAHIETYMSRFFPSKETGKSLEKLRQENSAVIIGGQQAGILTGPLYTIHKVISIIQLARQKESELGIPIVPVFWIAGEDHDYQEVNHVYVPSGPRADKSIFPQKTHEKKMVTDIAIDKELCKSWVSGIVAQFGETCHTKDLFQFIDDSLEHSRTFTDFFAEMIMRLFRDSELLLIDSGNPALRRIESGKFEEIINSQSEISSRLLAQQEGIREKGFKNAIEVSEESANLFYYEPHLNERVLLDFDKSRERFTGKNGTVTFSYGELIEIARNEPHRLSNNVVTRPLMQEWLFPVLAFIGGPGEIAYWAELKLVFEHFGIKMPPIVPRLNITILERSVETDINELGLDAEETIKRGTEVEEKTFLESIRDSEIDAIFTDAREAITLQYKGIGEKTKEIDESLLPLLRKNEDIILNQVTFMQKKLEETVKLKHKVVLDKYARVALALRPEGSPQERVWNILYYLNQYGLDFSVKLLQLDYEFDGSHKLIRI